jgi:mRNA interferase HigB
MHIISRKRLLDFSEKHPNSSDPLNRWYRIVKHSTYQTFNELRNTFPHADQIRKFTVFNIGGNKYRLVAYIVYAAKRIYIRHILTHSEYDKGNWKVEK